MGQSRSAFFAVVGAVVLLLSACGSSADTEYVHLEQAEAEMLRLTNDAYGTQVAVGNIRCPRQVPQKKDLTFFCTVDVDGQPLRFDLQQTDDKGTTNFRQAQSVLITTKVEQVVTAYLGEHGKPGSEASCGESQLLVRSPGKEVKCTVTYADGGTAIATVGVKDTEGNVALLSVDPPV